MGPDNRNHFLIACRYVPYDRWFLTNISPSWKIKHLKQSIIAKALNLPFDRRLPMQDSSIARPPSPITFAPIEGTFQEGEFSDGLGNYEVEDQSHVNRSQINNFRISGDPITTTSQPDRSLEGTVHIIEPSIAEYKDQIYTSVFTLIRFSTGQILEEQSLVSWYNLEPHELVELHCSSPPSTFSRALVFGHMLTNGGSISVDVPTPSIPGSHSESNSNLDRYASSSLAPSIISSKPRTATLSLALADPPRLIRLLRYDLASYTEPYWEGWVRVLRVMRRHDGDRLPTGRLGERVLDPGATSPPDQTFSDSSRRWKADNDGRTKVKEWKERWAVIRNGVLSLSKNRDDQTSTRLPLSALVSLCGAEYFSLGHVDNDSLTADLPVGGTGEDKYKRPASSHSNLAPTIRAYRSASISDPSRVTEDVGTTRFLLTSTSSNSPTAPRVLSPLITQSRIVMNANPSFMTTPIEPIFPLQIHSNQLSSIDPEKSRCERAAVRELESEKMQKEMPKKSRLDRQVEYVMRWDDFGIGFGKGKAKGKEKEKDKTRRSGRDREEKQQKTKEHATTDRSRHPNTGDGRSEKEKDRNRQRQHAKDRQRGKSQQQHHRDRLFHPDDRYIPASREEAMAKGMMIVCAKFRTSHVEADKALTKDLLNPLQDIRLDMSAGNEDEESGTQEDKKRDAEWQSMESSPVIKSLPPPRKASLPGLGYGLTMLGSGGNITPSGSIFGGFFGGKDKDNDATERNDKQRGSDNEEKKSKQSGPTMRGKSDERYDGKKLNLLVNTTTLEKDAGIPPALFSPDYANHHRLREGSVLQDGGGYRRVGPGYDDQSTESCVNAEEQKRKKNENRVEWVVLDMGTEVACNSFLRILHRHFPPPIQSSFVHNMTASPFRPPSPYPADNVAPRQDIHGVPLALPYPEWRHDVVFRARSQGMRELGRPLELALYNWETQAAKPAQSEPKGYTSRRNSTKRRKNDLSGPDPGSDNDAVEHDNTFDVEYLVLDDSDEESEDESARWWQDIPRQLSLKGSHFEWATEHRNIRSGTEEYVEDFSPSSPSMFTNPFAFSPSRPSSTEPIPGSPVFAPNMEERLRPSISSSTLASNTTSSSSYSTTFGVSARSLKSSIRSFISKGERTADNISWQNSPESYQSHSYPRRIVSPSQTLSSPSSNESLGSYLYHRYPPRPFSPNSDFHLHNSYRQSSGSVLHHSTSMPASALRSMPSVSGGTPTALTRERTITGPTSFSSFEKPILTVAQIDTDIDDGTMQDDFSTNTDARPILSLAQIHQIETETEARIGKDYTNISHDIPNFGTRTAHTMSTSLFNESSVFQQGQFADDIYEPIGDDGSLGQDCDVGDFERGDGSLVRNNIAFRSSNTLPPTFRGQDYMGSVTDSASIFAKAILRKVRSGSSLQTPMGVHLEECEEDGGGVQI